MATITKPFTFSAGAVIVASEHNSNFDTIYNDYNTNITNVNISSSASIAASKLNLATIAQTIAMSSVALNFAKGTDIASAATADIGAAAGNVVDITGTTTVTAFGTVQAGTFRIVRFTGALTLTHNSTSLILPSSANITTANGDVGGFYSLGSGNWKCAWYQKQNGEAVVSSSASGNSLQTVSTSSSTLDSTTSSIPVDNTIPQNGEGKEWATRAITPAATTNKLVISVDMNLSHSTGDVIAVAIFQDLTANALRASVFYSNSTGTHAHMEHIMDAGTTSSTTFKVRFGTPAGTAYVNSNSTGTQLFSTAGVSTIRITEYKA